MIVDELRVESLFRITALVNYQFLLCVGKSIRLCLLGGFGSGLFKFVRQLFQLKFRTFLYIL